MDELWLGMELLRGDKSVKPSEELRVAVTFPRPDGGPGPTKYPGPITLDNVKEFVPEEQKMKQGIEELSKLGFKLTEQGRLTVSMKCKRDEFENAFNIKLKKVRLDPKQNYSFDSFYFPPTPSPWEPSPNLEKLIDNAYIQWPHMYMTPIPSAQPPVVSYYHLEVPQDVIRLLSAEELHAKGMKGEGTRVVMIDSGFAHDSHPFFTVHGYTSKVFCAGDTEDEKTDFLGHGTGESANFFSLAPLADFIGVKIAANGLGEIEHLNPASMLEGFQKASQQNPHIISISLGTDLRDEKSQMQRSTLPNSLKALEVEILHAVASGITVIVAAGNGSFSFPAMMPDVIAVGGVFVDRNGKMQASNNASAYDSKIYPGRHVPDVCGLVGMKKKKDPYDRYIMLPVPPSSLLDCMLDDFRVDKSETKPNDGWLSFSGTSAAAPQIAGVCALLKAKNPNLTPLEIKAILQKTAIRVLKGKSNPESSDDGKTPQRGARATGAGLVNAYDAWKQV